jgi:hypothetical protein
LGVLLPWIAFSGHNICDFNLFEEDLDVMHERDKETGTGRSFSLFRQTTGRDAVRIDFMRYIKKR